MSRQRVIGVLLNYRDPQRSVACAESLLAQDIDKVLIWDNSADGGESAEAISGRFVDESRVVIHVSSTNLGFAAGANAALAKCREWLPDAWILLINNDARLLDGGLAKLVEAMACHPEAKLVFPSIDNGGSILGKAFYQYWTGLLFWSPKPGCFAYASGCCLLIAPERNELPIFNEQFFMYGEDCELGWRLRNLRGALLHLDEVLVVHEGAASSRNGSLFYEERMVAAHLMLARAIAEGNPARLVILYFSRAVMLLLRACLRCLRYRSLTPWRGIVNGWKIAHSTRSKS